MRTLSSSDAPATHRPWRSFILVALGAIALASTSAACDDAAGAVERCMTDDDCTSGTCVEGICVTVDDDVLDATVNTDTPTTADDTTTTADDTTTTTVGDTTTTVGDTTTTTGDVTTGDTMTTVGDTTMTTGDMTDTVDMPDMVMLCGNGTLDSGELCDTGIAAGDPDACPVDADCAALSDSCTTYVLQGSECQAECVVDTQIDMCADGDGCCLAMCDSTDDNDCTNTCGDGQLDPPELCDTNIAPGDAGACPTQTECDALASMCETATLMGTDCATECVIADVACDPNALDGCCPSACDAATDLDCAPPCGNGVLDTGEDCDTAIPAGSPGACPETNSCTPPTSCQTATINGMECTQTCDVTDVACDDTTSDGCCSPGCDATTDVDCPALCGNGMLDTGEQCDTGITAGNAGACPDSSTCATNGCNTAMIVGTGCDAVCQTGTISACDTTSDNCCPSGAGCSNNDDPDCPAVCGNGDLENGEQCDTAIAAGNAGACADQAACDAAATSCQTATVSGTGCDTTCSFTDITACDAFASDGCCNMAFCDATNDVDCPATCGNGVVEIGELCDTGIAAGNPGACPSTCTPPDTCTNSTLTGTACQAECVDSAVTACDIATSDLCCPSVCNDTNDVDCGNFVTIRMTDIVLRDPRLYAPIFNLCLDVTDNANTQIATALQDDGNGNYPLSILEHFQPFVVADATDVPHEIEAGNCTVDTAGPPPRFDDCTGQGSPVSAPYDLFLTPAAACAMPIASTTNPDPSYIDPNEPGSTGNECYASSTNFVLVDLGGGLAVPLHQAVIAGEVAARAPGVLVDTGLMYGFLTETDAQNITVPNPLGGQPWTLDELLSGSATSCCPSGDCAGLAPDNDSLDVDGDGTPENGWWMYLDFTAEQVDYQ